MVPRITPGLVALCLAAVPAAAGDPPPVTSTVRPNPFRFEVQHTRTGKAGPTTTPDGRLTVKVVDDLTARVVDTASGNPVGPELRHGRRRDRMRINTWAFSADGRLLATASSQSADGIDTVGEVRVWDVATGKLLAVATDAHYALGWVHTIAFADNRTLLIGCDDISGK
jgi:WD40 repeat protein